MIMTRPEVEKDRYYLPKEAAKILGVSTATLRRWADEGIIDRRLGMGALVYYTAGDILAAWKRRLNL